MLSKIKTIKYLLNQRRLQNDGEYFCDLLNEPNEQFIVEQEEVIEREEENEQPITIDELQMAVSKMKNRKSPGDDDLPVEVLKAGGQNVMEQLLKNK